MNYVALYRNHEYLYGYIDERGEFCKSDIVKSFPSTDPVVLNTIKQLDIPNLGYSIEGNQVKIFDKSKEEYDLYILPVCVRVFDKLTSTKKTVQVYAPTAESLDAAESMYEKLYDELFKSSNKEEIEKLYSLIDDGNGIAYVNHYDFPYLNRIVDTHDDIIKLFESEYKHYIIGTKAA